MRITLKIFFTIITILAISGVLCAQNDGKFSYQSVVRNSEGNLVINQDINIKVSILQESANGTQVYTETIPVLTSSTGAISIEVGNAAGFDDIDWSTGTYFVKTETDIDGEGNYSIVSVSQLLSVPFALHAKSAENVSESFVESDPVFAEWDKSTGITITENQVADLQDYITEESDPEFSTWDKSTGIEIDESQISDLQSYVLEETDPQYTATFNFQNPQEGSWLAYDAASQKWQVYNMDYAPEQHTHNLVTNEEAGLMSATDKAKLNGIAAGAEANLNADWNATTGDAVIQNRPTAITDFLLDADGQRITNLATPLSAQDAATKAYVDELNAKVEELQFAVGARVVDIDGNEYATVRIGNQVWMAENLKTSKYNDGTSVTYYWYNNVPANGETYGALYKWNAVNTGKLCPTGWHVPSDDEWVALTDFLGGTSIAGGKLKEVGIEHWKTPNTGATNETGFTALPGGYRGDMGYCYYINEVVYWWSATEYDGSSAWERGVTYDGNKVNRFSTPKDFSLYVRCIKN